MRYFRLHQDVYFEKGALGGALYDFMRRRVQPLSPAETNILEQLERDTPVSEVAGAPADDVQALVERLRAESFGTWTPIPQRRDRYMPVLKLNLQGLVEPPLILSVLQLSLTSSCPLSCAGCGDTGGAVWMGCNGCERWPGVPRNAAWSHATIDAFFDDIEPFDIRNIFFNGGDPLAEPDLLEHAIRRAQERSRPPGIVISTNGSAATPALLDRLAEAGVKLNFFVLGETPEDYEQVCGNAGAFDATMQAIAAAQVRAIPFNVTLRLDGLHPDTAARRRQWAATLGAGRVFVSERITIGEDGGVPPAASLATIGPARVPQVTPEQFFLRRERHPCLTSTIAIGADLTVRPCPMIEDRALGHAGLESMHTVFRERRHERYWQLTKADVAGCAACEFRFACADCAAVDLAKRRQPALHAAICGYDPARASWHA
jgi:radical SAM protein with 4Fe4S-binding SPASM domain